MDLLEPISLKNFKEGVEKRYILAIVNRHSQYIVLKVLKEITTREVINAVQRSWISDNGKLKTIFTDQGRQYVLTKFKKTEKKIQSTF